MFENFRQHIKNVVTVSLELAHTRLEMARIELVQQKNYLIATLVILFALFILFLVGLISLLFALNAYLPEETKITVFFSISAVVFLAILALIVMLLKTLKKQSGFMTTTLAEISEDIVALKNVIHKSTLRKEVRHYDEDA